MGKKAEEERDEEMMEGWRREEGREEEGKGSSGRKERKDGKNMEDEGEAG